MAEQCEHCGYDGDWHLTHYIDCPNRGEQRMRYKQHLIYRSNSYHATLLKPLYGIEGRHNKEPGRRPFITSIADAKQWITGNLDHDAMILTEMRAELQRRLVEKGIV